MNEGCVCARISRALGQRREGREGEVRKMEGRGVVGLFRCAQIVIVL